MLKVMFQITMMMKMLSNHSLDQSPVNIHRNKIMNYLTVKMSFIIEKHRTEPTEQI